eukprot:CAMPEP_0174827980 /NCGR_PEP_ID=MMETSP1114-20130205/1057_1 /TAXON_ID=312471 /ORGANISM="Neobodo designis, Strain CCAP 1951/1" /LENGTH=159 /DNA_ID=CAMNT_0016061671 /DNA_START=215 /DNA_END=694 /DNA_ORIENTATION=+
MTTHHHDSAEHNRVLQFVVQRRAVRVLDLLVALRAVGALEHEAHEAARGRRHAAREDDGGENERARDLVLDDRLPHVLREGRRRRVVAPEEELLALRRAVAVAHARSHALLRIEAPEADGVVVEGRHRVAAEEREGDIADPPGNAHGSSLSFFVVGGDQ